MEQLCTLMQILRKYLEVGRWDVQVGERHAKGVKSAIDRGEGQGVERYFWLLSKCFLVSFRFDNQ
jgi:hypothetical protein